MVYLVDDITLKKKKLNKRKEDKKLTEVRNVILKCNK